MSGTASDSGRPEEIALERIPTRPALDSAGKDRPKSAIVSASTAPVSASVKERQDTALDSTTPTVDADLSRHASRHSNVVDVAEESERGARSLEPMDRGRHAWTFVFCSFVLEALIWGFPLSFGVFQQYYLTTPPFNTSSEQTINAIGNIAIGFQYLELPIVITVAQRRPQWVKTMSWSALAGSSLGLLLSSFATQAWHLVALQGVVVGISGGILYAPIVIWLSEWFIERRALAGSLIFGGSGIGGALFPLLINFLLSHTGGFRWTLRIFAILVAVCGGTALLGVKPRVPVARVSNPNARTPITVGRRPDYSFFKHPLFVTIGITTMVQSLAYFPVSLYIPSYSAAIGLSTVDGTVALAMFNLARVVGQVIFGHVCDKIAYTNVIIFSGAVSSLSAFLMWGFAHNLAVIFVFVIIFGAISGGFSSIAPPASADIVGTGAQSGMVYGCIAVFKGLAVIIGPIIAASLHQRGEKTEALSPSNKPTYGGYGFTLMEIFVGSMMLVTAAGGVVSAWLRGHGYRARVE